MTSFPARRAEIAVAPPRYMSMLPATRAWAAALAARPLTSTVSPWAWKYPASLATIRGRYDEPVRTAPTVRLPFSSAAPAAGVAPVAATAAAGAPAARDGAAGGAGVQARTTATTIPTESDTRSRPPHPLARSRLLMTTTSAIKRFDLTGARETS